jgi:hypothetical protein
VSTILRPVGPHQPRTYWVRRSFVLAIVLLLIILLAKACSGGGGGGGGGNNAGGQTPITPNPTQSSTATTPACDPGQLKLTMSTDTISYTVRQAPTLIGTFSNPDGPTCKLARSSDEETWTIKSGTPTVWATGCSGDPAVSKSLKIPQGGTRIVHIFWNGRIRTSDCTEGDYAQPGTYTLSATLDGVTSSRPAAVFHISA